ncbi:MAG TPA: Mpo1-like protein [Xanthomonadaceae bacterium]|nr:Mpo1-like protein [Xanthomonadaceae bacterium]
MTPLTTWFDNYSGDHRNATNQLIHVWCVPAILWSVVAMLWTIPVPPTFGRPGLWAGLTIAVACIFYWQLSHRLQFGMFIVFVASGLLSEFLRLRFGAEILLWIAITVFVIAWIGQFIGHKIEGRKPSFLTDLSYLLIGPLWVLAKLYRKLGIAY